MIHQLTHSPHGRIVLYRDNLDAIMGLRGLPSDDEAGIYQRESAERRG
ncbi:MAG: hypothetical protein GPOALKHO_001286 [Sodalis sp.]|nr:MAG: hypothetical protein GPOALKHO_001286 [Sodalis sp.]